MAIKDFMLKDSYSRIERIEINKELKIIVFYLSIYKDEICKETIINNLQFIVSNETTAKNYTDTFENALKVDINIIKVCYTYLKKRPEFAHTIEV